MKMKRSHWFLLSILMFVLFTSVMKAEAVNTGFQTNHLTSEEKNTFISNINILPINQEPTKSTIKCFDVNNNHLIAIGQNASERKTICVYSNEGVFQYGYTFSCNGDFGIEWDGENLNIYFVRSDVIVSVAPNGEVLDVLEVQNTIDNHSSVNHFIHSTQRVIDDKEYVIENNPRIFDWITASYSQVIVKDETGTETTIYDAGSVQLFNVVVAIGIVFAFVMVAVVTIVLQFIKLRRSN